MSAISSFQWNVVEEAEPTAAGPIISAEKPIKPAESSDKQRIAELEKKVALLSNAVIMFLNMKSDMETQWIDRLERMVPDGAPMSTYKFVLHDGFSHGWDQSKSYSKKELKEDIVTLECDLVQTVALISAISNN